MHSTRLLEHKLLQNWLKNHPVPVVVLDPVMVATSGDRLLEKSAEDAMREFAPLADVITPNLSLIHI